MADSIPSQSELVIRSTGRQIWLIKVPKALQPILTPSNASNFYQSSHMVFNSPADQKQLQERADKFRSIASASASAPDQVVGLLHTQKGVMLELSNPPAGVTKMWKFQDTPAQPNKLFWVSQPAEKPGDIMQAPLFLEAQVIVRGSFVPEDTSYLPTHVLPQSVLESATLAPEGLAAPAMASGDYNRYDRLRAGRIVPLPQSRVAKLESKQDFAKPLYEPVDPESQVERRKENKKGLTSDEMGRAIFDLFKLKAAWKIKEVQKAINSNNNKKVRDVLSQLCDFHENGLLWTLKPQYSSQQTLTATHPQAFESSSY